MRYRHKIRRLTKATKIAVVFFNNIGLSNELLNLPPICPPIKTVIKSIEVKCQSIVKLGFVNWPKIPAIELTKINKLAVAAIFLGVFQFVKWSNGAKNIPPPIPAIPDTKPIKPP